MMNRYQRNLNAYDLYDKRMGMNNTDEPRGEYETKISSNGATVTKRDIETLHGIDEHGSIHRAAAEMERSYAHMQRRVVELEDAFGLLTERQRGGAGGGGTQLTENAADLLARFERLRTAAVGVTEAEETVLSGDIQQREGNLGIIDTAAGRIRAFVPAEADTVEVSIRSDAITLTAPDDAPSAEGTSARNQFSGTVTAVETEETVAWIKCDIGAETPLVTLVTRETVDCLNLEPGTDVVAMFKATATRATATRATATDTPN